MTSETRTTDTSSGAAKPPASARTVEILRWIVIGLGILLVIAFFVLVGRILYLVLAPSPQPASRPAITREAVEAVLPLPSGASVKSHSLSGDRLAVHVVGPVGDSLVVVDIATGAVVSRIRIAPAGQ